MKQIFLFLAMVLMLSCNQPITWEPSNVSVSSPQPTVTVRLTNPTYNPATKKFKLDVEFRGDSCRVFGANFRFFYDATTFLPGNASTVNLTDYATGYGDYFPNPPYFGTSQTAGKPMFNLQNNPVTYVNGAFALIDNTATPIYLNRTNWTRLFRIELTVNTSPICPIVILDKKLDPNLGSFLPGSEGVTIAIFKSGSTSLTEPVLEYVEYFNWQATSNTMPYGKPICL